MLRTTHLTTLTETKAQNATFQPEIPRQPLPRSWCALCSLRSYGTETLEALEVLKTNAETPSLTALRSDLKNAHSQHTGSGHGNKQAQQQQRKGLHCKYELFPRTLLNLSVPSKWDHCG